MPLPAGFAITQQPDDDENQGIAAGAANDDDVAAPAPETGPSPPPGFNLVKAPSPPDGFQITQNPKSSGVAAGMGGLEASVGGAMEVAGRLTGSDSLTASGESARQAGNLQEESDQPTSFLGKAAKIGVGLAPVAATTLGGFAVGGPVGAAVGFGGGLLTAYGLSVGDIYNTLVGLKVDPEEAKNYAAAGAIPIALMETVPPAHLAASLLGTTAENVVAKGLARRLVQASAVGAAEQGAVGAGVAGTEEGLESSATGQTMGERGGLPRVAESAEQFGALGAAFGALGGVRAGRPPEGASTPETRQTPADVASGLGWTDDQISRLSPNDLQDVANLGIGPKSPDAPVPTPPPAAAPRPPIVVTPGGEAMISPEQIAGYDQYGRQYQPKPTLALPPPRIEVSPEGVARTAEQVGLPVDETQAGVEPGTARDFTMKSLEPPMPVSNFDPEAYTANLGQQWAALEPHLGDDLKGPPTDTAALTPEQKSALDQAQMNVLKSVSDMNRIFGHERPEVPNANAEDGLSAQLAQLRDEGSLEPEPIPGNPPSRAEPSQLGQAGNGPAPGIRENVHSGPEATPRPISTEAVHPEPVADAAENAGTAPTASGVAKDAAPTLIGDLNGDQLNATRKDISKATGRKGAQVFFHGNGAEYDPLMDHVTVGDDLAATPETNTEAAALVPPESNQAWRGSNVKATLEDGTEEDVNAGTAADVLKNKVRNAMKVLECLG